MNPVASPSPKIVQSRLLRTAAVLFVGAGAIGGYFFCTQAAKSDASAANTANMILAIRQGEHSSRAVLVQQDGSIIQSPGDESKGVDDREAVWRPDGNRIFVVRALTLSQDLEEQNFQIYRWNPESHQFERRTLGKRALAHPRFGIGDKDPGAVALATAGGRVLLFDPTVDSKIQQILPAVNKTVNLGNGEGDEASGGQVFREARWTHDKSYIVSVMQKDIGEDLVVQKANPTTDDERHPIVLASGEHIDFDVSPNSNAVVYTVLNFLWPDPSKIPEEFKKKGKITRPYSHCVAVVDFDRKAMLRLERGLADTNAFGQPSYSPDGSMFLVVGGEYKAGNGFEPKILEGFPLTGGQPRVVARGAVRDPSWHPKGSSIVFVRTESNGDRDIVAIANDGSGERSLTSGKGNFSRPQYSPQSQ